MSTTEIQLNPPTAVEKYAEQNVSMMQQMAQAQIQAAYIWAERHPRDWDVAEQQILKECRRPQFVAVDPDPKKYGSSIAMYGVPRGGSMVNGVWTPNIVRDLTIRFAEMALPYIRNASIDLWPMGEDENQRIFRIVRIDFESNLPEGESIIVPKTVERLKVKEGDFVISQRTNSAGKQTYLIRATNEEMDQTKQILYAKRKRNLILNMLPGWLKEAAKETIRSTQRNADAQDPDAARKAIFAGFAQVGVSVEDIKSYLGHGNDLNPAELEDLRVLYAGIAGGHTTWKEILAAKEEGKDEDGDMGAQIDGLIKELEMPVAQVRKLKGQYAGQPLKNLLDWLQGQVAKKHKDGGKKEEPPAGTTPAATKQETTTPTSASASENAELAKPKTKAPPPPPPAGGKDGW